MVGSNSKQFRGLGANFWTKLQLFLKRDGPRVDIKKDGGFLNKNLGQNGIFGSGPSNLDLMAQGGSGQDLI